MPVDDIHYWWHKKASGPAPVIEGKRRPYLIFTLNLDVREFGGGQLELQFPNARVAGAHRVLLVAQIWQRVLHRTERRSA